MVHWEPSDEEKRSTGRPFSPLTEKVWAMEKVVPFWNLSTLRPSLTSRVWNVVEPEIVLASRAGFMKNVVVPLLCVNVPLFVKLPPIQRVDEPEALKVVPEPIVTAPLTTRCLSIVSRSRVVGPTRDKLFVMVLVAFKDI